MKNLSIILLIVLLMIVATVIALPVVVFFPVQFLTATLFYLVADVMVLTVLLAIVFVLNHQRSVR